MRSRCCTHRKAALSAALAAGFLHDHDAGRVLRGLRASLPLFDAVRDAAGAAGPCAIRVTKSQVAFVLSRPFAWAWVPGRHLGSGHSPIVLSLALRRRDGSARWKQVAEPSPGRFMHHLEVRAAADVDGEVADRLHQAWEEAG